MKQNLLLVSNKIKKQQEINIIRYHEAIF